jgi:hypothetical protein
MEFCIQKYTSTFNLVSVYAWAHTSTITTSYREAYFTALTWQNPVTDPVSVYYQTQESNSIIFEALMFAREIRSLS